MLENEAEKKQITITDILITTILVLLFVPVLPLSVPYIFLIWKTKRKENFVIISCIAVMVALFNKIELFIQESLQIGVAIVKGFANSKFLISAYGTYSVTSWVILVALSLVIASYIAKRMRFNHKLETAGVSSFERKYRENGGKYYEYSY